MSFAIKHGLFKYNLIDHHAILGIPLDADEKQTRIRYLKIAQKLHPDTCKASPQLKQQATQILSKLVNPAYGELSRSSTRSEHLLVLAQTGQNIAHQDTKLTLASDEAKQLYQSEADLDLVYGKLVKAIAAEQYQAIDRILNRTARLSELNLVYLIRKQGQITKAPVKPVSHAQPQDKPAPDSTKGSETPSKPTSLISSYLRRAQEYIDKQQLTQAIIELKDALKLEPNNSSCHGLLGSVYLKQKQITMAKVHINKAWQSNPKDAMVIQAKRELDQLVKAQTGNENKDQTKKDSTANKSRGGILSGLFGGKKK